MDTIRIHHCEVSDSFVHPNMKLNDGKNGNGEARLFISNSKDICRKIQEKGILKIHFEDNYVDDVEEFVLNEQNFRQNITNRVLKWKDAINEVNNESVIIAGQNGNDDINRNYIGQHPHRKKKDKTIEEKKNIKKWDTFRKSIVPTITTIEFFDGDKELNIVVSFNKRIHKYNKPSGCSFVSIEFFNKFSQANNIEIQHAMNGVEHKERKDNGYFWPVDGYHNCQKHKCSGTEENPCFWNNYVFEFQGTYWHKNKRDKDLKKKEFYLSKGYNWFEINEYEWNCMKRTILKITRS